VAKKKSLTLSEVEAPRAYAWELEEGDMCSWAEPRRDQLTERSKPSPGAKAVCVRIVREKDWRRLMALVKKSEK